MKKTLRWMLLMLAGLIACSGHKIAGAQALSIPHPDDPAKQVEYFLEKPKGDGPWPTIVLLHGHQEWPRAGGRDEHSRGASTCSRIAQLSLSGAQHDRVKMNFCAFRILP
jgi:hypothetical protein